MDVSDAVPAGQRAALLPRLLDAMATALEWMPGTTAEPVGRTLDGWRVRFRRDFDDGPRWSSACLNWATVESLAGRGTHHLADCLVRIAADHFRQLAFLRATHPGWYGPDATYLGPAELFADRGRKAAAARGEGG